ncbi:flap endonuclease GEN homolog 1 [Mobula hypostoma]|uniref:flap endonuclease GEN homolog 1 n=1 Tax=Mobula hypostoma TaxID=723540 RepID=UPI002FC2B960
MGVNDLWQILEPVKEYVPLQSLKGKTLAVDMSLWVCEAQTVKGMMGTVNKPHLRNLFFRISYLTLMDVRLVFVAEGTAPKLKADTMSKRNEMRHGGTRKPGSCTVQTGRSRFKSVLRECCELLDYLGNPWVCAAGEAEAMCAYLNENGYVDGCITNDGDAFLYGAQTVYRNLTINTKDPHVDCYKMSAIKSQLGLDRDALIGLAILLGCDYLPKGVPGVGKELALRLVVTMNGQSLLQRFKLWKREFDETAGTHDSIVKKKAHCSLCQHSGFAGKHATKGYQLSLSDQSCLLHSNVYQCPCDCHQAEEKRKNNSLENIIKKKATACEYFPFEEVIQEFLISKEQPIQKAQWRRPKLLLLQNFVLDKMEWPRHYTCEKVLPLLSHYDMTERRLGKKDTGHLQPVRIVKIRIRNGIPCFEIQWEKPEHYVFSNEQSEDSQNTVTTIEEQLLFGTAYPDITAQFHREKAEGKEKKHQKSKNKKRDRAVPVPDEISQLMSRMNLQPLHKGLAAKVEPGPKSSGQQTNPSSYTYMSSCVKVSTDYSVLPEEFWKESKEIISQPANHQSAEDEKSDNETLFLRASENRMSPSTTSPSVSSLVAELHLSDIDWNQSFSTPHSECTPTIQSDTSEQVPLVTSANCCVPISSSIKLTEDEASKENIADPSQECVRKNMELFHEDTFMLQDFDQLPLKERILLKNSCQFITLPQPNFNSRENNFLLCSTSVQGDLPSVGEHTESLVEEELANNFKKKKLTRTVFSETQEAGSESYSSDKAAGHHTRSLTVPEKKILKDSMKRFVGTRDPTVFSNQISKLASSSSTVEKNKLSKQLKMKRANGSGSTVATSVCCNMYLSSEDSDTENSIIRKQRRGIRLRAEKNTLIPFCSSKLDQPQQNKSRPISGRICSINNQAETVNVNIVGKSAQLQLMAKDSKDDKSQKNTLETKIHRGNNAILLESPLRGLENYKHFNVDEDSIIVISDSPLPLSERLNLCLQSS